MKNDITVTIPSIDYVNEMGNLVLNGLKVHIKINTGMNRLGTKDSVELSKIYDNLKDREIVIEGIYTHIYKASDKDIYQKQVESFNKIIELIPYKDIPIIHISASDAMSNYKKPNMVNGCRLGIIMYGFTNNDNLELKSTFSLKSEVIQINTLEKGDSVGYDGIYIANEREKIAVVSIGYADGIIRKNIGRFVYINEKPYKIVGNICMDMLFVKVDDDVELHDRVDILKDNNHIKEVAKYLDTIPYEILCSIGKRVPRVYIKTP